MSEWQPIETAPKDGAIKVLFLDVDGVLNSRRTALAFGGYPFELGEIGAFDQVAIRLLQRLCDADERIKVVMSSAWRHHFDAAEFAEAFALPVIDKTGRSADGVRGNEIQTWLDGRSDVEAYAILDDDSDMLPHQMPYFVKTDGNEGMSYGDFHKLCSLLMVNPIEAKPRAREWRNSNEKLDWTGV